MATNSVGDRVVKAADEGRSLVGRIAAIMDAWSAIQREGVPISLELRMQLKIHHQLLTRASGSLLHGRG